MQLSILRPLCTPPSPLRAQMLRSSHSDSPPSGVELICNIILVSGGQRRDLTTRAL